MVHLLLSVTSRQRLEQGLLKSSEWLAPGVVDRNPRLMRICDGGVLAGEATSFPKRRHPQAFGLGWGGAAAFSGLGAFRDFLGYGEVNQRAEGSG